MKGKKILASAMGLALAATTLAGCGGSENEIKFLYTGTETLAAQMKILIDTYNDGQGKKDGIEVQPEPITYNDGDYQNKVQTALTGRKGADVYMTRDEYYKVYTQYYYDWTEYEGIDEILATSYDSITNRMRYDQTNHTSNSDDALYALPFYNNVSVMYYNKSALEQAGVKCISVPEDKIAEFNAGTYVDGNGKTKSQYGIQGDVYKRGFFRYDNNNYVSPADLNNEATTFDGRTWVKPTKNVTQMVFNDRIPISFDEIEDVGMWMSKNRNSGSPTDKGYYTEWWFNYGWSVGGDCTEDMSGEGDYAFTLHDQTPNYIVKEGQTFEGENTGKIYQEGETLEWVDKLNIAPGEKVTANEDGTFTLNGSPVTVRSSVASSTKLTELPSMKEVFARFCMLSGNESAQTGLRISHPTSLVGSTETSISYFYANKIAFLIGRLDNAKAIQEQLATVGKEMSITYCPIYKEYVNPQDGNSAVKAQGKTSTHSQAFGLAIKKKSTKIEASQKFIKWLVTEGQGILANNGYLTANNTYEETFLTNAKAKDTMPNAQVALDIHRLSQPGDWWYMPDRGWIDTWSTPLNNAVRAGTMTIAQFFSDEVIRTTNIGLESYKG